VLTLADFSERLKELRIEQRMTQEQLAEKFFLNKSSVSRYERGQQVPEVDLLQSIADYFDVSIDFLLGRTDIKNPYVEEKEKDATIPIAAHFKGKEMTEEQRKRIEKFIEFTLNEDD